MILSDQIQAVADDILNHARRVLMPHELEQIIKLMQLGVEKTLHRLTAEYMILDVMEKAQSCEGKALAQYTKTYFLAIENHIDNLRIYAYL